MVDLAAHIRGHFAQSLGSYGRPRTTEELKGLGLHVVLRRVGRPMREKGKSVKRGKKFKATTDSKHSFNIAHNLMDRDFSADRPNRRSAGNISFVWTQERWFFPAVILDLQSRRTVGWAVSNRTTRDQPNRAPEQGSDALTWSGSSPTKRPSPGSSALSCSSITTCMDHLVLVRVFCDNGDTGACSRVSGLFSRRCRRWP
ncbi:Transposase InsO and inactivated derivatives [Aliiruegeria lutimaris]|uniref:Transposase InsO and inactivated derivatives n=1 Tax=Aliiruegeria lutimaris TaxID=571298 RepID=A0A1G9JM53_9RHOB|nr:Transposase InsO and inactivated derivatives [Aliiruegeria lutimaris]